MAPAWAAAALPLALQAAAASTLLLCVLLAFVIVIDTLARWRHPAKYAKQWSALYSGRVWHKRFHPTEHSFTYPIFYAFLDLDELPLVFPWYLWPLATRFNIPALARFDASDHLKDQPQQAGDSDRSLADRVRDFVGARSGERPEGPVRLLTHLTYLGYCFNPVSFYYCYGADGKQLQAVVGEVSNTPWLEMHCYALAPGMEGVHVTVGKTVSSSSEDTSHTSASSTTANGTIAEGQNATGDAASSGGAAAADTVRYRFAKAFHVSPFMDMEHTYDWSFTAPRAAAPDAAVPPPPPLRIRNAMLKGGALWFSARLALPRRRALTAAALLAHLAAYPAYTAAVQARIHWQALQLWRKRVPFFAHPNARETRASRAIAAAMAPLWALQARMGGSGGNAAAAAAAAAACGGSVKGKSS